MKQVFQKAQKVILKNDVWIFVASLCFISLTMVNEDETFQSIQSIWVRFISVALIFIMVQFPALLFTYHKAFLKDRLPLKGYAVLWLGAFILYPIAVGILEINVFRFGEEALKFRDTYDAEGLMVSFSVSAFVATLLEINSFFHGQSKLIQFVQRIGIDRAIIGVIAFFSLLLGGMATSNQAIMHEQHYLEVDLNIATIFSNFPAFIAYAIQFAICYGSLFFFYYVNRYFLIPKLLKEKGLLYFIAGVFGTIVLSYPLLAQIVMWLPLNLELNNTLIPSNSINPFHPLHGAIAFIVITISTPIILVLEWFQQNHQIVSLEKQRAETELNLLKQQINPHFFFNTLNNLYSLSIQKSMQTPEVILQLAELMRYVIYKGQNDLVSIEEEIKYLKDYIQLQQIRLKRTLDFRFDIDISDSKLQVPPLLFIILIENAFKHGIEPAEEAAYLHITMESEGNELSFTCKNSYELLTNKKVGGLGLTNLQRRLDLRFPNQHELYLYDDDFSFEAGIKLQLS